MQKYLAIIFLLYSSISEAENLKFETWKVGKEFRTFVFFPKKKLLISKECVDLNKESEIYDKCKSKMDYIKNKPETLPTLKNGQHPGSIFCKEILGAEVRFASDRKGNTKTFCQLDRSIIIDNLWIMKNMGSNK